MPDSSEELLAFVSLGRVAAGTPTIGDVGALAWGHLRFLLPGATIALFVRDQGRSAMTVAYAAGPGASPLQGLTIGIGTRVSGWVAANGRMMSNAAAELDLFGLCPDSLQFAVAVPLIADGSVAGVMTVYAPEMFSDDQTRRLEIIAPHLATAVAGAEAAARPRPALHLVAQSA
jgi:GAF domain-containing protein